MVACVKCLKLSLNLNLGFGSSQTKKLTELDEINKDQEVKFVNYVSGMYSFYSISLYFKSFTNYLVLGRILPNSEGPCEKKLLIPEILFT